MTLSALEQLDALLGARPADGGLAIEPDGTWVNQWGAIFGGYVGGVLLHALERAAPEGQALSVAHVSFLAPLRSGPAAVRVTEHRRGRQATALAATLQQNGTVATATAWASVELGRLGTRTELPEPGAGPPEAYAPRRGDGGAGGPVEFVDRDFEIRPVPQDDPVRSLQWMRLTRLEVAPDEPLPAGAFALLGDMVGAGQFNAARVALGAPHFLLSLDLVLHLVAPPRGPWVLGVLEGVGLANGRAVGRGAFYDRAGSFAGTFTQQSLVRPPR